MAYTDIDDPSSAFQVKTWTGTNSSNALTFDGNSNLQPDWVMIKQRSGSQQWNGYDVIRGVQKYIGWNTTITENTQSQGLTAFGSDGFTVGSDNMVNGGSSTYVGYCWKAGGSASSNSNGSITSSVSADTTAGFSVVSTTGTGSAATIGHGLGVAPAMIIGKDLDRDNTEWRIYNKNLDSASHILILNNNGAQQGGNSATWNNTAPTSSVFSVGTSGDVNSNGSSFIFYCFAEKKGFSKFGKYQGNSSTDGAFIFTGFKPAFFMVKRIDNTDNWIIFDNKRSTSDGFNRNNRLLLPNLSQGENTNDGTVDFLSNGIRMRDTKTEFNSSSGTYTYMAFAENPFVTSTGIPTPAR